jgi:hypothetical protein
MRSALPVRLSEMSWRAAWSPASWIGACTVVNGG